MSDRLQSARDLYNANVDLRGSVIFIQDGNGDYVAETAQQTIDINAHDGVLTLQSAQTHKKNEMWEYWTSQEDIDVSYNGVSYTQNESKRNRLSILIERGKEEQLAQRITEPTYIYTCNWFSIDETDPALNLIQLEDLSRLCQDTLMAATDAEKTHERAINALIDPVAVEAYDFT